MASYNHLITCLYFVSYLEMENNGQSLLLCAYLTLISDSAIFAPYI